jgi:hypothetical protein
MMVDITEVRAELARIPSAPHYSEQMHTVLSLCDEVEKLRGRLEVVPGFSEDADGIACRDDTIALQDDRLMRQRAKIEAQSAEIAALQAQLAERDGVIAGLRDAGQQVIDQMTSTYRARNGREVGIQGDDGEKCWIVHSDYITELCAALSPDTGSAGK